MVSRVVILVASARPSSAWWVSDVAALPDSLFGQPCLPELFHATRWFLRNAESTIRVPLSFSATFFRSRFQRNHPPSLSSFQIKNKEICWAFNAAFIIWHPYVVSPPTQFINTLFELFRANLSSWFDVVLFWCYPIVFVLVLCASRIEFSVAWSLVEWSMKFYILDLYLFIDIFFTEESIFIYHRVLNHVIIHQERLE